MKTSKNILVHGINGIGRGHIQRLLLLLYTVKSAHFLGQVFFATNSICTKDIIKNGYTLLPLEYGIDDVNKRISFEEYQLYLFEQFSSFIEKEQIDFMLHDTFFSEKIVSSSLGVEHILILRNVDISYIRQIEPFFQYFHTICIPHLADELDGGKKEILQKYSHIHYIGYVGKQKKQSFQQNKIVVSVGYGGNKQEVFSFFQYISSLLTIHQELLSSYEIHFFLGKHFESLQKEISFPKKSFCHPFSSSFQSHLKKAKLFLGFAGYNTVNEIISSQIPSLFLPAKREFESQYERVLFFQKHFCHRLFEISYNDLISDTQKIIQLLQIPNKRNTLDIFTGQKKFYKIIAPLFQGKKVLIFKNIFLPKSEYFIYKEIGALRKNGFIPLVFSFSGENKDMFPYQHLRIIPKKFSPLFHKQYPQIFDISLYKEFLLFLKKVVEKENIEIVYTQFLFDASFIFPLKKIFPSISFFSAARGKDIYHYLTHLSLGFLEGLDKIFVRDTMMKSYLHKHYATDSEVVRSYLDISEYLYTQKDFTQKKILIGARFSPKKQIPLLLNLVDILFERGCIDELGVVGDGEEREEVLQKIDKSPWKSKIHVFGMLGHERLLHILQKYNIFINYSGKSSDGDDEGIPNLISENMLVGNLIFSTLTGGIGEVLKDGITGYTLSGDIIQDAKKIENSLRKKEIYSLSSQARQTIEEIFAFRHSIGKIISHFQNHDAK